MTTLIADCETNGLLDAMTEFHMLQLGDADGDDVVVYADLPFYHGTPYAVPVFPLQAGIDRLKAADMTVCHNGIGFDFWAINHFHPGLIERPRMLDTLVMARLAEPEERNHSLKAWGERLGVAKGSYTGDFSTVDEELLVYAPQDIVVGRALYHKVKHVLDWGFSCQLEHDVAWAIDTQERNGFTFDVKGAQALDLVLRSEIEAIKVQLQATFPPLKRVVLFVPKVNNKARGYVKDVEIDKGGYEAFNPSSRAHVAERLRLLGWKPKAGEMGLDGVPCVDEKTLSKLPYPETKPLMRYFRLLKMLGQLSDGKQGWLKAVKADGKMHGRVNSNGASTGRMSHFSPNVAQADKDPRMRALFQPRAGWKLVGCDAEGLEARCLAHRLAAWDHGAFTKTIISGSKDEGTDVHTLNLKALQPFGLVSRDGAKTFLYALMYGAGDWKLGETIKEDARGKGKPVPKVNSKDLGAASRRGIAKSMVGIDKLTDACKSRVKSRGYLIGLDGRHVKARGEHSALNTLLQGDGAVVMKVALVKFMERNGNNFESGNIGLCANIHDEVQIECEEDGLGHPESIGDSFAQCIADAGLELTPRCPQAGKYAVGNNWAGTH